MVRHPLQAFPALGFGGGPGRAARAARGPLAGGPARHDGGGGGGGGGPGGAGGVVEGCDVLTVEDGLIVDNRAYTNGMDLARQLGAMPPQGGVAERGMLGALNLKTRLSGLLRR